MAINGLLGLTKIQVQNFLAYNICDAKPEGLRTQYQQIKRYFGKNNLEEEDPRRLFKRLCKKFREQKRIEKDYLLLQIVFVIVNDRNSQKYLKIQNQIEPIDEI